jgi:hypothetical protein
VDADVSRVPRRTGSVHDVAIPDEYVKGLRRQGGVSNADEHEHQYRDPDSHVPASSKKV